MGGVSSASFRFSACRWLGWWVGCSTYAQWTVASRRTANDCLWPCVPAFLLRWSHGSQGRLESLYSISSINGELPIVPDVFWGHWMGRVCMIADGQSSLFSRKLSTGGLTYPNSLLKLMAWCSEITWTSGKHWKHQNKCMFLSLLLSQTKLFPVTAFPEHME